MTVNSRLIQLSLATLAVASAAILPASANDWRAWTEQDAAAPRIIYTDDATTQGAILVCKEDGVLNAMVTTKPGSLPDLMAKNAPYSRSENAKVSIGNEAPDSVQVRLIPAIDVVDTRTHLVAAKIFNAALLGEQFTMTVEHGDDVSTKFPAPNEAFRAFASTCKTLRESSEKS